VSDLILELRPPESRHYPSWRERLDTVARYSRPDEVHALCEQAYSLGVRTVLAVFDDTIREALIAFQGWRDVSVWAVVPNMFAFIRDLTDLGMVGAAQARFMRLTPSQMAGVGLRAVSALDGIRRRDLAVGTMLVSDMELAALRDLRVTRLFLHPQITEIALAGGATAVFTALAATAERLEIAPGLLTHNPLRAQAVLGPELRRFGTVIAPCNPKGYKMFPNREACERLFRADPARFVALEPTAGGTAPPEAALAHIRALGLSGAVLDVRTVEAMFRAGMATSYSDDARGEAGTVDAGFGR
jgi:hypothetical protein